MKQKILLVVSCVILLVLGISDNAQASTTVHITHQRSVAQFGRVTKNLNGKIFDLKAGTTNVLVQRYSLAKFPQTTWIVSQTADFSFSNHHLRRYYYVTSSSSKTKHHYAGWVWRGYLKTAKRVDLHAPYISQQAVKAWMGCESASLLEGLHYKHVLASTGLVAFMRQLPISGNDNPNNGFAGSPYRVTPGVFQSIFPAPLAKWGRKYHQVKNISGASVKALRAQLRVHNPVVVYVTLHFKKAQYGHYFWGTGINNSHVMLLDGYRSGAYHVADPNHGHYWVSSKRFTKAYNYRHYAVTIQ